MPLIYGRRMTTHVEQGSIHGVGAAIGRSDEWGDVVGVERPFLLTSTIGPTPEDFTSAWNCSVGGVGETDVSDGCVSTGEGA